MYKFIYIIELYAYVHILHLCLCNSFYALIYMQCKDIHTQTPIYSAVAQEALMIYYFW